MQLSVTTMIHVVGSMTQECTGLEQASSLVNGHSALVEQRVGVLLPPITTHQLHQPDTSLQRPPRVKLFPGSIKQPQRQRWPCHKTIVTGPLRHDDKVSTIHPQHPHHCGNSKDTVAKEQRRPPPFTFDNGPCSSFALQRGPNLVWFTNGAALSTNNQSRKSCYHDQKWSAIGRQYQTTQNQHVAQTRRDSCLELAVLYGPTVS